MVIVIYFDETKLLQRQAKALVHFSGRMAQNYAAGILNVKKRNHKIPLNISQ